MLNSDRQYGPPENCGRDFGRPPVRMSSMNAIGGDKELSDLLDFSAIARQINRANVSSNQQHWGNPPRQMFSPPVSGNAMKNGPTTMESMYANSFKQQQENNSWNSNNDTNSNYDNRVYDNQSFINENMHPFVTNNDIPPSLMNKNSDPFSRTFQSSRDNSQGMMNNVPMSPESLSPAGKPGSPYYPYSGNQKRPIDETIRGRGAKFPTNAGPKRRKSGSVYSPSPDDFGQDSPRYTSPKPNIYGDSYYVEGQHSADPWVSNNGMPPTSYSSNMIHSGGGHTPSSYNSMHHHNMPPHENTPSYHTMSPNHDPAHNMMSPSGLPPMSSFQRSTMPNTTTYSTSSPTVNGSDIMASRSNQGSASQQTGDALGKALASIYSTDHTSSSYGSNPSTPVSSPPPMSGPTSQWSRPATQSSTSSQFETHLHSLQSRLDELHNNPIHLMCDDEQSRMEERLDDAIHVLRSHAEGQMPGLLGQIMPGMQMLHGPPGSHSNGMMVNMGPGYSGMGMPPQSMESHMPGSHPSLSDDRAPSNQGTDTVDGFPPVPERPDEQTTDGGIKIEKSSRTRERDHDDVKIKPDLKSDTKASAGDSSGPPSKRPRQTQNAPDGSQAGADMARMISDRLKDLVSVASFVFDGGDDDSNKTDEEIDPNESPETKQERERLRRQANNARERVRVRDINGAFKELGRMVTLHLNANEKPQTKLTILQQAVSVITSLEQQVRERNLNPKAACLKRREEEKSEELPGRQLQPDDLGQHPMAVDRRQRRGTPIMAAQRGGAPYMHGAPLDMSGAPMVHHMDGMADGMQPGMSAEMHHQMMLSQGLGHEMMGQDLGPPPPHSQSVVTSSGMNYTEMDENIAHSHSQNMQRIGESIASHSQSDQ
ncbi:transcription factor 4-like isoform X3 [Lineus longissimus]|uniref:transcription factor 4-like isoform X3 n=1 Tax=Lineus longissimus TaxID=88925 RepID=UPI00315C734B